eukprot:scaffold873_cov393-Prasinococcus_capsulatus_cf.AAC.3
MHRMVSQVLNEPSTPRNSPFSLFHYTSKEASIAGNVVDSHILHASTAKGMAKAKRTAQLTSNADITTLMSKDDQQLLHDYKPTLEDKDRSVSPSYAAGIKLIREQTEKSSEKTKFIQKLVEEKKLQEKQSNPGIGSVSAAETGVV